MSYRPEDWRNPHRKYVEDIVLESKEYDIYEAGADAKTLIP